MRVINTTTLKRVSSAIATIYYFAPFLIILCFSIFQLLNINESYLLKLFFGQICQNGNSTLASIVCPIPPVKKVVELKAAKDGYQMPILVATTKSSSGVTIKTDNVTPSHLYTIVEICSDYKSQHRKSSTILEDVCNIVNDSINSSELKKKLDEANRDNSIDEEVIKWTHVSILMQKLPLSGKIWHLQWLSHINKDERLSEILKAMVSVSLNFQENTYNLKARTDALYRMDDPFLFVSKVVFPVFINADVRIRVDSLKRLFMAFPEAFSTFVHARSLGFRKVNFLTFEPDTDRFTFLSVYLGCIQLLATYILPPIKAYNDVIDSDFLDADWSVGTEPSSILQEFINDKSSKAFMDSLISSVGNINLTQDETKSLFMVMELGLQFSNVFLLNNSPIRFMDGNVLNRDVLIARLRKGLILLGKFISSDSDSDGILSFKEFINAGIKDYENILKRQVLEVDQPSIKSVRIMKTKQDLRDKVVEEFVLADRDKDNNITLQEYMDVLVSTELHNLTVHV